MEKTFRDILTDLLDKEDQQPAASEPAPSHGNRAMERGHSFEPFWRPDATTFRPRANQNQYRNAPHVRTQRTPERDLKMPSPPLETRIALDALPIRERECVTKMIRLGAINLKQGLSVRALKKAHRHLARKFHPDYLPATATPAQIQQASGDFISVQEAYGHLHDYLAQVEKKTGKLSA